MSLLYKEYPVTQEHINKGRMGNSSSCPVARAIRDKEGGMISVSKYDIEIGRKRYRTPKEAREFICDFDWSGEGAPFTLKLLRFRW